MNRICSPFRQILLFAFVVMVGIGLSSCQADSTSISVTVAHEVALSAAETVASFALVTPAATLTLLPELTAVPTSIPQATYTPRATLTPNPTYTPNPTLTAMPTLPPTATLAPLPTSQPSASVNNAAPPAAVDNRTAVKLAIDNVLYQLNNYQYAMRPSRITNNMATESLPSDCPVIISAYDSLTSVRPLDVARDEPTVQNAYNAYVATIETIKMIITPFTNDCRTALANNNQELYVGYTHLTDVVMSLEAPKAVLNQFSNELASLSD